MALSFFRNVQKSLVKTYPWVEAVTIATLPSKCPVENILTVLDVKAGLDLPIRAPATLDNVGCTSIAKP